MIVKVEYFENTFFDIYSLYAIAFLFLFYNAIYSRIIYDFCVKNSKQQWVSSNIVVYVGGTVTELYILVLICLNFNYLLLKEALVKEN